MKSYFKEIMLLFFVTVLMLPACKKHEVKNYFVSFTWNGSTRTLKDTSTFFAVSSTGISGLQIYDVNNGTTMNFILNKPEFSVGSYFDSLNCTVNDNLMIYLSESGNISINEVTNNDVKGTITAQLNYVADTTIHKQLFIDFYVPYYK